MAPPSKASVGDRSGVCRVGNCPTGGLYTNIRRHMDKAHAGQEDRWREVVPRERKPGGAHPPYEGAWVHRPSDDTLRWESNAAKDPPIEWDHYVHLLSADNAASVQEKFKDSTVLHPGAGKSRKAAKKKQKKPKRSEEEEEAKMCDPPLHSYKMPIRRENYDDVSEDMKAIMALGGFTFAEQGGKKGPVADYINAKAGQTRIKDVNQYVIKTSSAGDIAFLAYLMNLNSKAYHEARLAVESEEAGGKLEFFIQSLDKKRRPLSEEEAEEDGCVSVRYLALGLVAASANHTVYESGRTGVHTFAVAHTGKFHREVAIVPFANLRDLDMVRRMRVVVVAEDALSHTVIFYLKIEDAETIGNLNQKMIDPDKRRDYKAARGATATRPPTPPP